MGPFLNPHHVSCNMLSKQHFFNQFWNWFINANALIYSFIVIIYWFESFDKKTQSFSMNSEWITYFRFYVCTSERQFNAFYDKTERERATSRTFEMKQKREYMTLFFSDFCIRLLSTKFSVEFSFSLNKISNRIRWSTWVRGEKKIFQHAI